MNLIILLLPLICTMNSVHSTDSSRDCSNYMRKGYRSMDGYRSFVNCLGQDVLSGQSDLVVMIDRSSSAASNNGYQIAQQFVMSLLSEVKISFHATRIAVITFANDHTTDIDFLRNPTAANNKCKFNELFEKLPRPGGGSNIRGAMDHARKIFWDLQSNPAQNSYRRKTNKVAILLSDGIGTYYEGTGNPRDASHEANRMKSDSIILYTVALTTRSDSHAMKQWATEPSAALYAGNFNKMQLLAHNIRGDAYEKAYDVVTDRNRCGGCRDDADCGCNLIKGNHRCVCRRGYYGTGDKQTGNCTPCEKDTYGGVRGILHPYSRGLPNECKKCPVNSVTDQSRNVVAQSVADCKCAYGYLGLPARGIPCTPRPCAPYPVVNFASVVNKSECIRPVYKTQCEYKCAPGFKMVSKTNKITCGGDGYWSKEIPACV